MSDTPKQLQNARVSVFKLGTAEALGIVQLDSTGGIISGGAGGGSTQVSVKDILTSSGASVMDGVNNAINVNVVAGAAAGSTQVTIRQSTYTDLNALSRIADRDQSTQVAAVLNTDPPSTAYGIAVRQVGAVANSTLVTVRQSTYTDFNTLSRLADRDQASNTANVTNTTPASTAYALAVREVAQTTGSFAISSIAGRTLIDQASTVWQVQISTVQGQVRTAPASTVWATSAGFHFDSSGGLQVNVVAGTISASTEVVIRQSTFTDLNCRINAPSTANSSNYLPVRITDGSSFLTPGNEYTGGSTYSSFAGPTLSFDNSSNNTYRVVGLSTPWPVQVTDSSNAAVKPGDSANNAIRVNVVAGAAGGSTIVTVSTGSVRVHQSTATDLLARVNQGIGNSTLADRWTVFTANSSAADYNAVRLVDSSGTGYHGPTKPLPIAVTDSSNAVVKPGDSANNALRVNVIAGSAAGTQYTDAQSTIVGNALTYLDSSAAMRGVASTRGLPVQIVAGSAAGTEYIDAQSTIAGGALIYKDSSGAMRGVASTRNLPVYDETVLLSLDGVATSLQQIAGATADEATGVPTFAMYMAGTQGGTLRGIAVDASGRQVLTSTQANLLASVYQSTAADLNVTARLATSSGGGLEGSTTAPAVGVTGLHVRQVFPTMQSTTLVITSTHSTAIYPVISSAAGLRHKVYAYFIGSTHTNPSTLIFCSSASASGFDHWSVNFGSGSSGITGANLALPPPGFIFAGISQNALNVRVEGGSSVTSTVVVRIALSWFDEA